MNIKEELILFDFVLLESILVRGRWQDLNKNLLTALSGRNVLDTWLVELLFFFQSHCKDFRNQL